jgi:hypothetical protein
VVVDLPWPKEITAHNNGSWKGKSKVVANYRMIAKMIALDALNRGEQAVRGPHVINYTFFVPDNRKRDRANMVQQCKAFIDGICDAKAIDGDHWQVSWIGTINVEIGSKIGGVRLEIVPKKEG